MHLDLTPAQKTAQAEFRHFVDTEVMPLAQQADLNERTSLALISKLAAKGWLGAILPQHQGGCDMDMITYGLLNEELGRGCSSLRSLLTVHSMVIQAISKWGSAAQKEQWLPVLATGEKLGAFALTEPQAGSDAQAIQTTAIINSNDNNRYQLNGQKKWTTYGQIADVFLVFALCEGKPTAFLVPRETPGFSVKPISGLLGVKASMLAELTFENCSIPAENMIGRVGFGLAWVASAALDYGRYTVAWGCIGIAQGCLEACLSYTQQRQQFGQPLKEHPLIRQMISDMVTQLKAARLLCYQAGYWKQLNAPCSVSEISIAKYFAATMASKVAGDAVQIHGANGCHADWPVERYWRDAKIMEIIEGSNQIHQLSIADYGYQSYKEQNYVSPTISERLPNAASQPSPELVSLRK